MKPTKTTTTTRTTQVQINKEALREAFDRKVLDRRLEQILRMSLGIGEPGSTQLEFRGQSHEETRIKLAMIERECLNEILGASSEPEFAERKSRIIEKLRNI